MTRADGEGWLACVRIDEIAAKRRPAEFITPGTEFAQLAAIPVRTETQANRESRAEIGQLRPFRPRLYYLARHLLRLAGPVGPAGGGGLLP